ncbi:MAG TPA: sulfite exporter TauE/SafE family protein [Alphaproteobacteria bacterium]|nr:sulfite exporter TauE/SafE family protein [Alphaproteobacteria bacterium]
MPIDFAALAVALAGVVLIAFMRGAFGGGFAIIGIPLLSLVMDPITAGALLAPLFIAMDVVALRYWKPSTWSKPDLIVLVPAMVAGIAIGFAIMSSVDHALIAIVVAVITLGFAGLWFLGGGKVERRPRSTPRAIAHGAASGITSMIAHSGGPALAMYLLPLGLPKHIYAGTTSVYFTVTNATKAGPWLLIGAPTRATWLLMLLCVPAVPLGIWAGWKLHERLDQQQMYRACYALLVVTALKLLFDGVSGLR